MEWPLQITIPLPEPQPRKRGIHATTVFGSVVHVRLNKEEREMLEDTANNLGLTMSEFIRSVSINTTKALKDIENAKGSG